MAKKLPRAQGDPLDVTKKTWNLLGDILDDLQKAVEDLQTTAPAEIPLPEGAPSSGFNSQLRGRGYRCFLAELSAKEPATFSSGGSTYYFYNYAFHSTGRNADGTWENQDEKSSSDGESNFAFPAYNLTEITLGKDYEHPGVYIPSGDIGPIVLIFEHNGRDGTPMYFFVHQVVTEEDTLLIRNDSGGDLDRFRVLGVSGVVDTALTTNRITLTGVTPQDDGGPTNHLGNFAVLAEDIDDDDIGSCWASGVFPCEINVGASETTYLFADIEDGGTRLVPRPDGAAEILWRATGSGIKNAIVRLTKQGPQFFMGTITAVHASPGTPTDVSYDCETYDGQIVLENVYPQRRPHGPDTNLVPAEEGSDCWISFNRLTRAKKLVMAIEEYADYSECDEEGGGDIDPSEIQFSASDKILGRSSSGGGDGEEIDFTDAAQQLADDPDFATMRATLGLASMATQAAGAVAITGGSITGMSSPSGSSDVATKGYVDTLVAGLKWKAPVKVATTANGTLATAYENGDTVDGVALVTGDRILLKDQTTATENGIYTVNASGAPTRATDADSGSELINAAVFVEQGTANTDKAFVCTNNSITLGSTNITFVTFASALGALQAANNLSDVANAATAVNNLGGATSTGSGGLVRATSPTIVTPTIASLTNAQHTHQDAAGGGTLNAAAIAAGTLATARLGSGTADEYTTNFGDQTWKPSLRVLSYSRTYLDFSTAATANTLTLITPASTLLCLGAIIEVSTVPDGGKGDNYTLKVGTAGNLIAIMNPIDVFNNSAGGGSTPSNFTIIDALLGVAIVVTATSNRNLNTWGAGAFVIHVLVAKKP